MYYLTIFIFAFAALLGIILLSYVLRNKETPKGLAIIHGSIAALGLILLITLIIISPAKAYLSLIFFVLAGLGGFTIMYRDLTGKFLPKWLALGHGLIAVTGFILLIVYLLQHQLIL
jgi:hypothetical protein